MDLGDIMSEIMQSQTDRDLEMTPVCILKDHLDLARGFDIYNEEMEEMEVKIRGMIEAKDERKMDYFKGLSEKLVSKGVLTRTTEKKAQGMQVRDGVVFIKLEKKKKDAADD